MSWADRLQALWWQAGPPPWPLRALAALFGGLVSLRRAGYQRGWWPVQRLPLPVIVVGNRIVGGAGKTPVTLALVDALRAAGWSPGIVSRGHGRDRATPQAVTAHSLASAVGDEPLLMARRAGVPLWVGADRVAAARALCAAQPEVNVLVCDDGLQHLRLGRDLALIVFDGRGAGNGHLLPAGPLREPLQAPTLARQQWLLYNHPTASTDLAGWPLQRRLDQLLPLANWWSGQQPAPMPLHSLAAILTAEEPAWALAGIGHPERFFNDLRAAGLHIQTLPMPDHTAYDTLPWPEDARTVIVTEKDAVKLDPRRVQAERPMSRVWVAPLQLTLPAALQAEINTALGPAPGAR